MPCLLPRSCLRRTCVCPSSFSFLCLLPCMLSTEGLLCTFLQTSVLCLLPRTCLPCPLMCSPAFPMPLFASTRLFTKGRCLLGAAAVRQAGTRRWCGRLVIILPAAYFPYKMPERRTARRPYIVRPKLGNTAAGEGGGGEGREGGE